ncbi:uncharacterized protein PRCAT00004893001 [Priceomyces carsonii]|uniref:uncharacterized protein n=1 Tax=Priceomyces carsonii TaxID=28549 RepID=UPI002ED9347D|nr:unnamed protein product [Priceomyces carsonii]
MKLTTILSAFALANTINGLPLFINSVEQAILKLPNDEVHDLLHDKHWGGRPHKQKGHKFTESKFKELPLIETADLQDLVTEEALREKAEVLYNISLKSVKKYGHPTRVIGSPGHWGTIHYVAKSLRKLKGYYKVKTQSFKAIDGKVKSFSLLIDGVQPKSLLPLALTPPTLNTEPVNGKLVLVDNLGCSPGDYPESAAGNIVLIKRGECAFQDKSINAGTAGALGAIIYDSDGSLHGTLGKPTGKEVATVSVSENDVKSYVDALTKDPSKEIETTLYIDSYVKAIKTLNVIAETRFGNHDNVVSLGAHSDSVGAGPGINDDGTGSLSLLEVAENLSKFRVNNAVRFAWWAAEEEGLLGSYHYANTLSPEENAKVRLFMDYDMMASPNYEFQVYDANNVDHPDGSGDLKDLYIDWYKENGHNYSLIPFDGRSDYVGFIDVGIPAGGIATGAEAVKSPESEKKFGGHAGEWLDPCYHQLCDDLSNPAYDVWTINTKLISHSVATYAKSFEGFPERDIGNATSSSVSKDFAYRGPQLIF